MADLKHCAQMAGSKCHHPIEFLYPKYANDRYAIQRDARSIGLFSWVELNKYLSWFEQILFDLTRNLGQSNEMVWINKYFSARINIIS